MTADDSLPFPLYNTHPLLTHLSGINLLIHWSHSLTYSSLTHSLLIPLLSHLSLINSLTHSIISHSLTHSPTHLLTHLTIDRSILPLSGALPAEASLQSSLNSMRKCSMPAAVTWLSCSSPVTPTKSPSLSILDPCLGTVCPTVREIWLSH